MVTHTEIVLRLSMAALLGGLVGLERERLEWVAGLRTHMLVCLGSTLVMIVSVFGFADVVGREGVVLDPSRVAAQVVSGIGFLGAGTILFLRREVIRGLTTAASLWTVAGVGLAVGGGLYTAAIATTALILVILALVKPLERRMFRRDQVRRINVVVDRQRLSISALDAALERSNLLVKEITLRQWDTPEEDLAQIVLMRGAPRDAIASLLASLREIDGVRSVSA